MGDSNFRAKDIGFRAQKKLLSRMANKSIAKVFIDDATGNLLDNLYKLGRSQSGNKKEAEKVVKNIIKIVIKIGILYRNDQFNQEELWTAEKFKHKFHSTAMAIISFYEVEFSYDRNFLLQSLNECCALLKSLVVRHLTEKSINRIEHVFNFFASPTFLDDVFSRDSHHKDILGRIVSDMHRLMEDGSL
ncbi:tumor necrosis factor alpha-induced protein 8-like protein isoform X2 [Parasteatoda tepidariorum]|nr:tumor necrosis factor alpha-induced protein 8-like protein isoform X2 [Parasteatoda tepidariorum]XP_015907086.1 tumor necrosis factor alpha-induced protein 8-like protein isoform X2 [Parasteatoda tepidariorum]XP_015907093.1 tumor necrosis factor alpha-induced protein 8-like protein isoform X2 [Parasteatoda tepidariorum]